MVDDLRDLEWNTLSVSFKKEKSLLILNLKCR